MLAVIVLELAICTDTGPCLEPHPVGTICAGRSDTPSLRIATTPGHSGSGAALVVVLLEAAPVVLVLEAARVVLVLEAAVVVLILEAALVVPGFGAPLVLVLEAARVVLVLEAAVVVLILEAALVVPGFGTPLVLVLEVAPVPPAPPCSASSTSPPNRSLPDKKSHHLAAPPQFSQASWDWPQWLSTSARAFGKQVPQKWSPSSSAARQQKPMVGSFSARVVLLTGLSRCFLALPAAEHHVDMPPQLSQLFADAPQWLDRSALAFSKHVPQTSETSYAARQQNEPSESSARSFPVSSASAGTKDMASAAAVVVLAEAVVVTGHGDPFTLQHHDFL
jgi:hypothetical protein